MSTITIEVPDELSPEARIELIERLEAQARHEAYTMYLAEKAKTLKKKPKDFWYSIPVDTLDEKD